MKLFFDTSALLKLFHEEDGSRAVETATKSADICQLEGLDPHIL